MPRSTKRVSFSQQDIEKTIFTSYEDFYKFMQSSNFESDNDDEIEHLIRTIDSNRDDNDYFKKYTLNYSGNEDYDQKALSTDVLIKHAQSTQSSLTKLNTNSKIKYFLLSCAIEAYNQDLTHPFHKLIYSDPSHDIDDQIALAKTLALNVLFGGHYYFEISGHIPHTSIEILRDYLEKIKPIAIELKREIQESEIIDQRVKIYLARKFLKKFNDPSFSAYLTDDILKPQIAIGSLKYFGNKFNISPDDKICYFRARNEDDYIVKFNTRYYVNPFSQIITHPNSINIEILSKITRQQTDILLHNLHVFLQSLPASELSLPNDFGMNLFTQGKIFQGPDKKSKGEFNLENIAKDDYLETLIKKLRHFNPKITMCASNLTKELGFGQFESSEISTDSPFYDFTNDLIDSYNKKKQGWAISGMPIKEFNSDDVAICYETQSNGKRPAACLSFAGILSLKDPKTFPSANFPALRLLNDCSNEQDSPHQNFATYHMTPLRLIGEMLKKVDDNFFPLAIQQKDNEMVFEDFKLKKLAQVFLEFYKSTEDKILKLILTHLSDHHAGLITYMNVDIQSNIEDFKEKLMTISADNTLSQEIFAIINDKINEILQPQDFLSHYQFFLKQFTDNTQEFVLKNNAYDTIIPDLSRILDSKDFETLSGFQVTCHLNNPHGFLILDQKLVSEIEKSPDADIKKIWEKIKKFKSTLNKSFLNPQKIVSSIKHNAIQKTPANTSKKKPEITKTSLPDQFNEEGIYNGGLSDYYGIYLPVKGSKNCLSLQENDFTKFMRECSETPQAGGVYLPYYDSNNVARLYFIGKDTSLEHHNNFQIQLHQGKGNIKFAQNFYCQQQILNPHVTNIYRPRSSTKPSPIESSSQCLTSSLKR